MKENKPEEGDRIKTLCFSNGDMVITSSDTCWIVFHNEFHGEYDLDWALVIEGGKEIARHNLKFVESIVWI